MTPSNAATYAAIEADALRAAKEYLAACRALVDARPAERAQRRVEVNMARIKRQAIESDLRMTMERVVENEAVGRRSHLSIAGVA